MHIDLLLQLLSRTMSKHGIRVLADVSSIKEQCKSTCLRMCTISNSTIAGHIACEQCSHCEHRSNCEQCLHRHYTGHRPFDSASNARNHTSTPVEVRIQFVSNARNHASVLVTVLPSSARNASEPCSRPHIHELCIVNTVSDLGQQ